MKPDIQDDQLRDLFKNVELDNPSPNFESQLMSRIQNMAAVKATEKTRKAKFINGLALILGVFVMLVALIVYFSIQGIHLKSLFAINHADPIIVGTGITTLFLLIGDTLIRKKLNNSKTRNSEDH